jgi:hypothetical protein
MNRNSAKRASKFQVRFSEELHERLRKAADFNSRPINSEIVHRLEASFSIQAELAPAISQLIERMIEDGVRARLKAIAVQIGDAA